MSPSALSAGGDFLSADGHGLVDVALLEIAQAAYQTATVETPTCHALVHESGGAVIIAFRGTDPRSLTDLLRDADAVPFSDPVLGDVNGGFFGDVVSLAWRLIPKLSADHVMVTGHSKGGAEALIFGAMLAHLGRAPSRLTTFGAARTGRLADLLDTVAGADYRNGGDPVPYLPLNFDLPRPLRQIGARDLNPLNDHYLAAYRASLMSA